jgi:hypothetical protein
MLRASCHCGAVVLELARRPRTLTECNCSICRRYGALWTYCSRSRARVAQGRRFLVRYVSCADAPPSPHAKDLDRHQRLAG